MSHDAVRELLRKAEEDPELTKRLEDALARENDPAASFLAAASAEGCEFTADEFVEVMEGVLAAGQPQELADAELSATVGGGRGVATNALQYFRIFRSGHNVP